jgi:hypothetical protein
MGEGPMRKKYEYISCCEELNVLSGRRKVSPEA